MPKAVFEATKLTDANVQFISLVERGANRIPFRVKKQENPMSNKSMAGIDLGGLGSLFSRKSEKPEVVAVVTMKGESLDSTKALIEAAGFSTANVQENEDGSVVFKQGDHQGEVKGGVLIRLSEDVALVTKGFSPYNLDVTQDGVSFSDLCASRGFYPGINTIMEVLAESVRSTVYAASSVSEAQKAVSKLLNEANAYVSAFLGGLPQKAFKLEGDLKEAALAVQKADKAKDKKLVCKSCGAEQPEGTKKCSECGADPMAEPKKKKDEADAQGSEGQEAAVVSQEASGAAEPAAAAATAEAATGTAAVKTEAAPSGGEKPLTKDEVSGIVASQVEKLTGALTDSLAQKLEEVMKVVKSSSDTVNEKLAEFGQRVEKAEAEAGKATASLGQVVVTGAESGDQVATKTLKQEYVGRDRDTAFETRSRK